MRERLNKKYSEYLPPVISGALLALSFPVFDLFLLAWIAFVPLLLSLWQKNLRQAFISGFIFGMTFFFITLYWIYHSINHFGGVPFLSSIILVLLLCCYLSIYPAFFALLFSSIIKKTKLPALFIAPVLWVALEFLRSYALSGFPWASTGYSQYKFLYITQISDITGVYGISFLVLAVNGAFAELFLLKNRVKEMPLFPVSFIKLSLGSLLVILLFTVSYGIWRLGQERPGRYITAGLVQGNIEQGKKWEPSFQKEVIDRYFTLSTELSKSSPDLIIWPEASVPFYFGSDSANTTELMDFQKNLGSGLLFGSVLVKEHSSTKTSLSNSAILLDKEGKIAYTYDKIHMVPFGEYVPLKSILFFIDKLVVGIGDYSPGKQYLTAETEFGSFGTLICYEIIFPGMVRKFYTKGGDFIVTITNDAWFGKTSGPYQHFNMAVFRAIENRKPVMRAANTGVSGFIDSNGKILAQSSLFKQQTLLNKIKTDSTMTFYTKFGDLFSYLCIVLSVILLVNIRWRR
ncbi:MAG: apolipoprotein N-acyltransferase [Nitrospirae bacterium GWC2_42_7]|nr:MAG: apolipoprotein N-acyltransferase [Nitrospirae bacterium GWC2_42_7]